jgi:hypothetical protein
MDPTSSGAVRETELTGQFHSTGTRRFFKVQFLDAPDARTFSIPSPFRMTDDVVRFAP